MLGSLPLSLPWQDTELRKQVIQSLTDESSPVILLPEFPDTDQWQHLAALRHADPHKGRALTQLFSAAVIHSHEAGMVVPYRSVPDSRFGRMYAMAPSGSKLSRAAGLILFGRTHCEIDMVGAHLGIFIGLVRQFLYQGSDPPHPFVHVQTARDFLERILHGTPLAVQWPTFKKHLWPLALNSPDCVRHVCGIVTRSNLFLPLGLREALVLLESLKTRLADCPDVIKPPENHPRLNPRNSFYYIMEGYESKFMLAFLRDLVGMSFPRSIVFRCDGIYVQPFPPLPLISHCTEVACRAVGITGLQVKFSELHTERAVELQRIYAQVGQAEVPGFFSRFCRNEWWENLAVPRPQAHAGHAEQRKRAHVACPVHDEDPNTLHRFIKRRKLMPVVSSP